MGLPFVTNPELTAVAIAFANDPVKLIADRILPRVPVAKDFKWTEYPAEQAFTVPDMKVGRKGQVPKVEFYGIERTASVEDFGLSTDVPNDDVDVFNRMPKASGARDPRAVATEFTTHLVNLGREIRVANTVFNTANYLASNRVAVSSSAYWDNPNTDIQQTVLQALDTMLVRPNVAVVGRQAWTKIRSNPQVVSAVYKNSGNKGAVSLQAFADLLEIDEVVVGEAWVNTARRGQNATMQRVWGKNMAFLNVSPMAAQAGMPTWGYTAQFGTRIAGTREDGDIGLKGGINIRVGEQVKELVSCQAAGYLFSGIVA